MTFPTPVPGIEWRIESGLLDYDRALADMESRAAAIAAGTAGERRSEEHTSELQSN